MKEMFEQIAMRLALCGLAASLAVYALRSWPVRAAIARLAAIWRGLTAFGRVAVCSFLLIGILIGGDKTNNVPPNLNSPLPQMQQGGVFLTGFTGLTELSGALPHTPSSTNLVNLVNPVQTTPVQQTFAERWAANWNVCCAWKDSFWLPFEDGWVFPYGTNHLSGVEVVSQGMVWPTPFDTNAVAAVGVSVEIVPGLSSFGYEFTPSNSYRFVWTDAAINRDTNNLVFAALELFRNGDVSVMTNGVAAYLPRELPFPHNGFGQDDVWVTANFTNATEILAVGYPQWVDAQVGTGLTNGLYKLAVTLTSDPPETTFLSVGDFTIAVTNSGEYVFLVEKGPAYDLTVFPANSNVTVSAVDDIVPKERGGSIETALPLRRGALRSGGGNYDNGMWTPDGGLFWTDYAPGMGNAQFWWLPCLFGSPDVAHIDSSAGAVEFHAELSDYRGAAPTFLWTASEGLSIASPNSQTTEVTADETVSWDTAYMSVSATFGGDRSLTSYIYLDYGTNDTPQIHLSLDVPDAVLLNSNAISAAKVASAGWSFWSDAPTSGVVRVFCVSGADRVLVPELVGEWAVSDSYSVAATLEGIGTSAALGDVVFRMEFCGGDATNTTEKATTVVRVGDVLLPSAPADGLVVLTNTPVAMLLDSDPAGSGSFLSATWHTRRLKSDGSYDEWQLAEYNHHGASILLTPLLGGIYQIRALVSVAAGGADERFYVWEADENVETGLKKRGNLKMVGICDAQWQIDVRNAAKTQMGSTAYLENAYLPASHGISAFPWGRYKCNAFVAHMTQEAGVGLPVMHGTLSSYPPLANELANAAVVIQNWPSIVGTEYPQPGYVAAEHGSENGHCGIVDFDGKGISAGMLNVNRRMDACTAGTTLRKHSERQDSL